MTSPSLNALTTRYLAAKSNGSDEISFGDVQPHEVITSFRADPATTWNEARIAFSLFGVTAPSLPIPGDWSSYVANLHEANPGPLCLGVVPQSLRDLTKHDLKPQCRSTRSENSDRTLAPYISKRKSSCTVEDRLIVAACYRLSGNFTECESTLASLTAEANLETVHLIANERAAMEWSRGNSSTASAIWNAMPDSPAVYFNRGLVAWHNGKLAEALLVRL